MNKKIYKAPMAKAHQLRTSNILDGSGFRMMRGQQAGSFNDRSEEMQNNSAITEQTWGSQW